MRIFFNDTPLILLKPNKKIRLEEYQFVFDPKQGIPQSNKFFKHVLITNVEEEHVVEVIRILRKNVYHELSSISMTTLDYKAMRKFIKSNFKIIKAAGGLVRKGDKLLMIHRLKRWDFPKGKLDDGEKPSEAAVREVNEECGIEVKVTRKICNSWHTYSLNGKSILKKTYWYEMQCLDDSKMAPQEAEDIEDVRWLKTRDLFHAIDDSYRSIKWVFRKYRKKTKLFGTT